MEDNDAYNFGGKNRGIFEEQNIKCSVELKNGVPQRSMNSHKNSNALILNQYNVSSLAKTEIMNIFIALLKLLIL